MKKSFLTLISLALLFGCSESKNADTNEGPVHLDIVEAEVSKLSEVFDHIEYLQLDLPESLFILQVDKVLIRHDNIYIFDYSKSMSLYVLSIDGKYKFHIDKAGSGPGEYHKPVDFEIGEEYIEILDVKNRILFFDLNGFFIKEVHLPFNANKFTKLSEGEYLLYTKESISELGSNLNCELVLYNISTKEHTCLLQRSSFKTPYMQERNVLAKSGSKSFFSHIFSDTIYSIDKSTIRPEFILDFGNRALKKEQIDPTQFGVTQILDVLNNSGSIYHNPGLFVNKKHIITSFRGEVNSLVVIDRMKYDFNIVESGTENDIDGGLPFGNFNFLTDDYLGTFLYPESFGQILDEKVTQTPYPDGSVKGFVQSLDLQGPLILVKYYLK